MHVNPRHPAWRRIPLAVACFLLLMMVVLAVLAVQGDPQAWFGVIVLIPVTGLWAWCYRSIRKEQHV